MCSIEYLTTQIELVLPTFFQLVNRSQNYRIFNVTAIVYPLKYLSQYNSLLFDPPCTHENHWKTRLSKDSKIMLVNIRYIHHTNWNIGYDDKDYARAVTGWRQFTGKLTRECNPGYPGICVWAKSGFDASLPWEWPTDWLTSVCGHTCIGRNSAEVVLDAVEFVHWNLHALHLLE